MDKKESDFLSSSLFSDRETWANNEIKADKTEQSSNDAETESSDTGNYYRTSYDGFIY